MNLETIWKLLILLAAIAVVQLDWSIGRVSLILLAVTLAPIVVLGGAYGLIMLFASDQAEIHYPPCLCGDNPHGNHHAKNGVGRGHRPAPSRRNEG